MSIKVMSQVWAEGPSSASERLLLLALADFADDNGVCWPSMETIAEKACMSERNARRVVRKLESEGYLETMPSSGRASNRYKILSNPDNMSASPQPGQMAHSTRTNEALNPDKCDTNPDIAVSGEPSIEPSRTVREPSGPSALTILNEILRTETAADFIAHRKAMKKPVTPEAAKRIVSKLRDCRNPDAVVDESIANGWQGVFPERAKHERQQSGDAISLAERVAARLAEEDRIAAMGRGEGADTSQPLLPARYPGGSN